MKKYIAFLMTALLVLTALLSFSAMVMAEVTDS